MAGDPILLGLSGAIFLLTAESGGRVQSYERRTTSKRLPVYNAGSGMTDGQVFHDFIATYDIEVISTASTGINAAAPGVVITLGNPTTGNGVSAGGVYTTDTRVSHRGEDLQRFTLTAEQRPGIT